MKKLAFLILVSGFIASSCTFNVADKNPHKSAKIPSTTKYICPMDTDIQSDKFGQCQKCGMDLELNKNYKPTAKNDSIK